MIDILYNYGASGDFPESENVLADDTVGGLNGLFSNIAAGYVATGKQWGANGTEFTGTGEVADTGIFFIGR